MTKNPSFRLILLLTLLCFSNAVFAEKGKGCTETVIVVDTMISQRDFGAAQDAIQATINAGIDDDCKRKLLALGQRSFYLQGQFKSGAASWKTNMVLFEPVVVRSLSQAMPYPENTGFLFAGLSTLRSGGWLEGGWLLTHGVKHAGYGTLRVLRLEDEDMHYVVAGLGAALDTLPAVARPLIPMILGKWESGGNVLSVLPDAAADYYIGRSLVEYRQWEKAIPFLQKALATQEKHPFATEYLLGKCFNELKQFDKAAALLRPLWDQDKSDWVTAELERAQDGQDGRLK